MEVIYVEICCRLPIRAKEEASRDLSYLENMSAFKRKRGGQNHVDKKAKKGKFVPNKDDVLNGDEQEKNTEVTIPPPVSMVNIMHVIIC